MASVWSWDRQNRMWLEVQQTGATSADVERKYAAARKHDFVGAAFLLLPQGQRPEDTPEALGVPVVQEVEDAKAQRTLDDFTSGVHGLRRRIEEIHRQAREVSAAGTWNENHERVVNSYLDEIASHLVDLLGIGERHGGRP